MLNETVTITICGKNYRLKTDNSAQTVAAAKDIESKISEYCSESLRVTKEDASVFAALDCLNELYEMKKSCKALAAEAERLQKGEEEAKIAVEKCRELEKENTALKQCREDLEKLTKRFSELEGKNEQLALALKEANVKALKSASLEKALSDAKKGTESLEKKNEQLVTLSKDIQTKLDTVNKTVSEKEKRISELEKEQAKAAAVIEENKRLSESWQRQKTLRSAMKE